MEELDCAEHSLQRSAKLVTHSTEEPVSCANRIFCATSCLVGRRQCGLHPMSGAAKRFVDLLELQCAKPRRMVGGPLDQCRGATLDADDVLTLLEGAGVALGEERLLVLATGLVDLRGDVFELGGPLHRELVGANRAAKVYELECKVGLVELQGHRAQSTAALSR